MDILLVIEKTDCVGNYMPSVGETFRVTATITDLTGTPVVAGTHLINLYDGTGTLKYTSAAPTHTGGGIWYADFTTAASDNPGNWLVVWKVTIGGGAIGIAKAKIFVDDPPI